MKDKFVSRKIKIRRNSFRYYSPGTIFREADGLYTVTACISDRQSRLLFWKKRGPMKEYYKIVLEGMTVEEEIVHEVMSE